jgi:GNAT superfamily N-acetyltransferase
MQALISLRDHGRMQIREATGADADFLLDMLVEACNWSGDQRVERRDVASHPHLGHYIAGWPRPDDLGVIAIGDDGTRAGAAWARVFSADHPGYGFVASDIPEVSMAVVAAQRGRGIGRRLLETLIAGARRSGWRALSLSVEDGNPVAALYARTGFVTVARAGTSETMLVDLGR